MLCVVVVDAGGSNNEGGDGDVDDVDAVDGGGCCCEPVCVSVSASVGLSLCLCVSSNRYTQMPRALSRRRTLFIESVGEICCVAVSQTLAVQCRGKQPRS